MKRGLLGFIVVIFLVITIASAGFAQLLSVRVEFGTIS
jgi:hypothetical protein